MTSSGTVTVRTVESSTSLAAEVVKLGDSLRMFLGHFPFAAWDEAVAEARVMAAVDGDRLLGYVLVRLPRTEVVVVHLAVAPEARGVGVSHALIRAVCDRFANRTGIRARCRRDYPSNQVWPALGFTALGNLPGRGAKGELLTLWWLDLGHPDLFSWEETKGKLPVLMDANVFIDLHAPEPDHTALATRSTLERVSGLVELLVAPETGTEINRRADAPSREPLLSAEE